MQAKLEQPGRAHARWPSRAERRIEAEQSQAGAADNQADDDEFAFPDATPLSPEQKDRLRQLSNLVKMGNLTHENVLKEIAKSDPAKSGIDLDEVEELGKQLEEAQDELVAACLYGEADAGLEVKMFDKDADEDEDADANGAVGDDADVDLTEEQAIEKAILRTFEQYVQAVVTLSAYVTDRDELVEKVKHCQCHRRGRRFRSRLCGQVQPALQGAVRG